jgi:hypothetical protein
MSRNRFNLLFSSLFIFFLLFSANTLHAQYLWNADSAFRAGTPNSGRLWGLTFGDYFHKSHSDSLNRGGFNQYTNVKKNLDEFQFRRIYIGYDYNISKTFSVEFLLAAEDDVSGGDLLQDNRFSPYIKLANLRWKNFLFKGNDLLVGLQPTPAYSYMSEYILYYTRPVERTITDIRRTPSFDFGAGLQGRFNSKDSSVVYGYNLLVANGTGARAQDMSGNLYKWFYGDAYVGILDRRLIFDLYADYQRLNWNPTDHGHSAHQMIKGVVAWVTPKITFGVETYVNRLNQAETGIEGSVTDTLDGRATGSSFYISGVILKSKLNFFARYDIYNPNTMYNNIAYTKYAALYNVSKTYEPNNKERFLSLGLDFTPIKHVHFIPNIWFNKYVGQAANLTGPAARDYDLVYRFTFFFTFGKLFGNPAYAYYPYIH